MPGREKVMFEGHLGSELAGLMESPDGRPRGCALMAHCFTCGKDIAAASRIARGLVARGYAVFRFDFTGLGNSDGDFANTHFSSNVQDLVAAADYLRTHHHAPSLLIGHSLGGTAVLNAAHHIPEIKGVVTIGAPADAQHVARQFQCDIATIEAEGMAEVNLAGRQFTIRKTFLDDIATSTTEHLAALQPALLVMHSPIDETVSVTQAERIYKSAPHPKSFVSLDDADHLLTRAADAEYVAGIIAAWSTRFLPPLPLSSRPPVKSGQVVVQEQDHVFLQDVFSDHHRWLADEPVRVGGSNAGADPYEHLLAAVGSCTSMTLRMYARRKGWPLHDVRVTLSHAREHATDCEHCDESAARIDVIVRDIQVQGDLDADQRQRLLEIADRCPVHRTLCGSLSIRTALSETGAPPDPAR